jgi:4-amino-4-deoxy-L-arabinose transferase-like glycosyltransferase
MATAEERAASGSQAAAPADAAARAGGAGGPVWAVWAALAVVLALALALRLWGVRQGLPYAYNADEDAHFVPRAIGMLTLGWNPHYFANPPAYTDLLRIVFAVWFGGRAGVARTFATDPAAVFTLARVCAALLGTAAVWLLYLAGARLFDRGVALVAAALEAVAFLPVFYAHLALNDVPTLAPLTLSLVGTAGVLRKGRARDYALAGVGLGLGCATKYTAGVALLPLVAAAACHYLASSPPAGRRVVGGLCLAGAVALAAFLLADPYSLLDLHAFEQGIAHQSSLSGEAQGKLGAPHDGGFVYYLWSLTWGLGWVPAIAAAAGAVSIWRRHPALGWVLVPAPVLFLVFMGSEGRYFGRWLLPIFPILCLLAAFAALALVRRVARGGRLQPALAVLAALALCAQGLLYAVHSDRVLARADTRNLARAWMVAHVPAGARVVVEPVVPAEWVQDVGHPTLAVPDGDRWVKYESLRSLIGPTGALLAGEGHAVTLENYELTLAPSLVAHYEREGYCWVVSGSAESGRALADPARAPHAVAYYRALARAATVVYRVSPYRPGARPPAFNFDWSFDYYPLAYVRPGPEVTVYRLRGGRCAPGYPERSG